MRRRLMAEERRERRRRAVQRSKYALPSSLTLISVLCGFSGVVMSINAAGDHPSAYFLWAAGLLIAAAFFDGLNGRVAVPPIQPPNSVSSWIRWRMSSASEWPRQYWPTAMDSSSWDSVITNCAPSAGPLGSFSWLAELSGSPDSTSKWVLWIPASSWACPFLPALPASRQWLLARCPSYCPPCLSFRGRALRRWHLDDFNNPVPKFQDASQKPKTRLWVSVTFVAMLSLLHIFQAAFILGFFAAYILLTLFHKHRLALRLTFHPATPQTRSSPGNRIHGYHPLAASSLAVPCAANLRPA